MKELDRKKDYGLVYGLPGVAFEQDGVMFDIVGQEVTDAQEVEEPTKRKMSKYDVESQRAAGKRSLQGQV